MNISTINLYKKLSSGFDVGFFNNVGKESQLEVLMFAVDNLDIRFIKTVYPKLSLSKDNVKKILVMAFKKNSRKLIKYLINSVKVSVTDETLYDLLETYNLWAIRLLLWKNPKLTKSLYVWDSICNYSDDESDAKDNDSKTQDRAIKLLGFILENNLLVISKKDDEYGSITECIGECVFEWKELLSARAVYNYIVTYTPKKQYPFELMDSLTRDCSKRLYTMLYEHFKKRIDVKFLKEYLRTLTGDVGEFFRHQRFVVDICRDFDVDVITEFMSGILEHDLMLLLDKKGSLYEIIYCNIPIECVINAFKKHTPEYISELLENYDGVHRKEYKIQYVYNAIVAYDPEFAKNKIANIKQ